MASQLARASQLALMGLVVLTACTETPTTVLSVRPPGPTQSRSDSLRAAGVRISPTFDVVPDPGMVSCGGSEVDCPEGVTATPGYVIGASQPGEINVTLGAGAHAVTVVGSGAIDCSGNYGDLVGYGADGREVGRTSLQLIDPGDCSPADWPDNITYGATATLTSAATIVRIAVTPMSPITWTFDWFGETLFARATQYYTVSFDRVAATLEMECVPAAVTRGGSVKCTASASDGSTPTVTKWHFKSTDPSFTGPEVEGPVGLTWEGALVVSGVITVTGKIGTGAEQTKDAVVQVTPRDWSGQTIKSTITPVATPYDDPPRDVHQLGSNSMSFRTRADTYTSVVSGPNAGFAYFTALPFELFFEVNYNDKAMQVGSAFYNMQPVNATTYKGKRYCARSRVVSDIPLVKAHEGFGATDASSHTDTYTRAFLKEVSAVMEKYVAASALDLNPQPVGAAASTVAADQSHQITDLSLANPYHSDCEFNYDPSLKIP